jgi:hypothetical protein
MLKIFKTGKLKDFYAYKYFVITDNNIPVSNLSREEGAPEERFFNRLKWHHRCKTNDTRS